MVRCADCGYLARWFQRDDGTFAEIPEPQRHSDPPRGLSGRIVCFARAFDLPGEAKNRQPGLPDGEYRPTGIAAAIRQERVCGSFTKWRQGFSPREHADALDRARVARHTNLRSWLAVAISLGALAVALLQSFR